MASRKEQKEAARQRRLEQERVRAERARRDRRLRMLGGLVVGAVILVGVAIAISSGGSSSSAAPPKPTSVAAKSAAQAVNTLVSGIPQSGTRLGSPKAPVTVTEYGDLQCPICKAFALSGENELIAKDVRAGKVQLVYRSTPTATANGPDPNIFPTQQAAAYAAGEQQRAWNYILLFYHEQGGEDTSYVNSAYLDGLAQQVPGLNFSKWSADRLSPTFTQQVSTDEQTATSLNISSTPTIIIKGPKSQTQPVSGALDYGSLESAIKSVS
jgi:protein-disulfide isomerase